MALNEIFQVVIGMNLKGQKLCNVLHLKQTSIDGPDPPNKDACLAVEFSLIPGYQAITSEDLTFEVIRAHRVGPTVGGTYVHTTTGTGGIAVDTIPPNGAVLATLYSDLFTRRGRGRIYIPGVPDTWTDSGRIVNAQASTYASFLDILLTPITVTGGATYRAGVFSTDTMVHHAYIQHQVRSRLVTIRSRRMENPA
jgi:hypothetical protein